jgi:subtilisin family serine protease
MRKCTIGLGLAVTLVLSGAPAAQAAPKPVPAPKNADPGQLITLVTGDKVLLTTFPGGQQAAEPIPGPGRGKMAFTISKIKGDLSVVPADALPLLSADRLDSRLFDVSLLARDGYDDAHRADIPLLQSVPAGSGARAFASSQTKASYPRIGIAATSTKKSGAVKFWQALRGGTGARKALAAGVRKLWLDGRTHASLDQSVPQIGAPQAWSAGFTGKDVPVAVLDTGLDAAHQDFAGEVLASQDFSGSTTGTLDKVGHGTHVASTVAGSGAASGGKYKGVAPGARLLVGKVLGDDGSGSESGLLAGMQWAVDQHARVVNMSLGSDGASDGTDPLSQAVNTLTAQSGTLFVASAGNSGQYGVQVGSPAAADSALAVAAVTKQDQYADFSNFGPRLGDYAMKPDISAPGVDIVAARATGSDLGEPVGESYQRLSGTSMAAPHIAGAAAILAQEHPDWKADQLKSALMSTSKLLPGATVYQQGAGRVDVARAYQQKVTATGSISFGYLTWPHTGQHPVTKTVTYRNDGDAPITLALSRDVAAISLSATSATVPAHGTASVNATLDPATAPAAQYGGWLTATSGDSVVRTSIGGYQEPEKYDLSVTVIGRDGKPVTDGNSTLAVINRANGQSYSAVPDQNGVVHLRLDPGNLAMAINSYDVINDIPQSATMLSAPTVQLATNTALTLDLRNAKQSTVAVDQPARSYGRVVGWYLQAAGAAVDGGSIYGNLPIFTGSVGKSAADFRYFDASTYGDPEVVASGSGYRLMLKYAPDSPRATSKRNLQVVNGGTGSAADLSKVDIKGRVVLAQPTDNDPAAIVADVAKAGGVALILPDLFFGFGNTTIPIYAATGSLQPLVDATAHGPANVELSTLASSRYRYDLYLPTNGAVPTGTARTVRRGELGRVLANYRALGSSTAAGMASWFARPDGQYITVATPRVGLPSVQEQFLSPGVNWQMGAALGDFFSQTNVPTGFQTLPLLSFKAGQTVRQNWNTAVYAPRVSAQGGPFADRIADTMTFSVPMLTDSDPQHVDGTYVPDRVGSSALFLDGKEVTSGPGAGPFPGSGQWTVPAAGGAYEFRARIQRTAANWPVSTDVSATWSFRSAQVDSATRLPLLDVRYAPPVDDRNRVPVNAAVPAFVGHQQGSSASAAKSVRAWASFDDGKTWSVVQARGAGANWVLPVIGGKSGGFVSLRVQAVDPSGNAVDETILRAYQLR